MNRRPPLCSSAPPNLSPSALLLLLLGGLVAGVAPSQAQQRGQGSAEPGFQSLFDGHTLQGWEGNPQRFRVEKQAIVGGTLLEKIPRNEFLTSAKVYADFELRLQVKALGDGVNGGIQVRSRRIPDHHEMIGYQADIGQQWWGALYDESRRKRALARPAAELASKIVKLNDWNDYVIRCEGKRIRLWLNGEATVDYTEQDDSIEQTGLIGLQIHGGPPSEVWYRNIRIRELESSPSAPRGR